jgi:flavin-dependent dehydrogenase
MNEPALNIPANSQPSVKEVCIIGGGLAGLSLSILLARSGHKVILFEKEKYPFHKVCGEYISMESWNFLMQIGLPLSKMNLPVIKKLIVSSPGGKTIKSDLDLGGFGISRYLLDYELSKIARQNGVQIYEETKVNAIIFKDNAFKILSSSITVQSKIVAGAFGKRSNIDVKWSRDFIKRRHSKLNNYIAVKYHVQTDVERGTIALHNFKDGYCGISQVEDNKCCLCYLTTAGNLKANSNSIPEMEKNVLQKNPHLKKIFSQSQFLYEAPVTISQISFDKKSQVQNHALLIGDAAGMITPLCGNGMSMALHAAKIAFEKIDMFLKDKITRQQMEEEYIHAWKINFSKRLQMGRIIQSLFGKASLTNAFISIIKFMPFITRRLIRSTHGQSF